MPREESLSSDGRWHEWWIGRAKLHPRREFSTTDGRRWFFEYAVDTPNGPRIHAQQKGDGWERAYIDPATVKTVHRYRPPAVQVIDRGPQP